MDNKLAFTMAEVLITIGIIGLVAAMTLPGLINNAQNKEKVTALKKAYSVLSQATLLAVELNGDAGSWGIVDKNDDIMEIVLNYYKPQLKILKVCQKSETGCWVNEVTDLKGSKFHWYTNGVLGAQTASVRLEDGMTVTFDVFSSPKTEFGVDVNGPVLVFFVDVNGEKNPNQFGRDIFAFVLDVEHNTVLPAGRDNDSEMCSQSANVSHNYAGIDCAAKVLREDKISY